MNPLALLKPWLPIVYLALLALTYGIGHYHGTEAEEAKNLHAVAVLNEKARQDEEAHASALNTLAIQLQKANADADIQNSKLRTALRTGSQRLYVTAACPVQAAAGDSAPTGDRNETRAELDPAVAESLVAITEDGDRAIRQLNACIDAYNDLIKK